MNLNFEYIAAHISDYIKNENFFDTFDMEAIKTIIKNSHLTVDQYNTLLKQSSPTINAKELYICTRKANVTIQNLEEVVSILKSLKKYMKFNVFDGIVDVLNHTEKDISDFTREIKNLQDKLKAFQNQTQNTAKETTSNQTNENCNHSRVILAKIAELKQSNDFETVYKFLDELSSQGNHAMISKSCDEGLWRKIAPKKSEYEYGKNVLHVASEKGNFRLVKSLIECGCDKEAKTNDGYTPLIFASQKGHLDVVKYLISVGADKEAKDDNGWTPLFWASRFDYLEVVKYRVSKGVFSTNLNTANRNKQVTYI
ncbi:hypothetical protein TVAG_016020 [Trichomonas vaginalis G3]|uniref:Uncharacterized protein n=1 Tax=Trichomonas vaginalis (strain ATCC PRA-98 / G3) TaxID=412133 RepID=A2DP72_TRIV3|nr:hypothetical protein TVAG_016020 [Trichomonas vaginalis G3]|eukprot:XP_001329907.1 hypothetical protein [Trichomonas vaginalis G3]